MEGRKKMPITAIDSKNTKWVIDELVSNKVLSKGIIL